MAATLILWKSKTLPLINDLSGTHFQNTHIVETTFVDTSLSNSVFINVIGRFALRNVNLSNAQFLLDGQCGSKLSAPLGDDIGVSALDLSGLDLSRVTYEGFAIYESLSSQGLT